MVRTWLMAAALALLAGSAAMAADPAGTWLVEDRKAKVRIAPCGDALCGSVAWLSAPLDAQTGKPLTDRLNADPAKRSRPILGLTVLIGMQRNGPDARWHGRIYNPEDGKTYAGSIEVVGRRLHVRGCVAFFCETKIWTRAD
ncbi:MAG TPA: DUF2147 domain-containing protein [Xanthobacteraceae bacterium]|nr:DUF2147 domain-containing protein [Xanthobacteraceae bacterium]